MPRAKRPDDLPPRVSRLLELMHDRLEALEGGQERVIDRLDRLEEGQAALVRGQEALVQGQQQVLVRLDRLIAATIEERTAAAERGPRPTGRTARGAGAPRVAPQGSSGFPVETTNRTSS